MAKNGSIPGVFGFVKTVECLEMKPNRAGVDFGAETLMQRATWRRCSRPKFTRMFVPKHSIENSKRGGPGRALWSPRIPPHCLPELAMGTLYQLWPPVTISFVKQNSQSDKFSTTNEHDIPQHMHDNRNHELEQQEEAHSINPDS